LTIFDRRLSIEKRLANRQSTIGNRQLKRCSNGYR